MYRGVIDTPQIFWSQIPQVRSGIVFITMGCFVVSRCRCICTAQCSTVQIHGLGGSVEVLISVAPCNTAALLPESAWVSVPCWMCWGDTWSSILRVLTH